MHFWNYQLNKVPLWKHLIPSFLSRSLSFCHVHWLAFSLSHLSAEWRHKISTYFHAMHIHERMSLAQTLRGFNEITTFICAWERPKSRAVYYQYTGLCRMSLVWCSMLLIVGSRSSGYFTFCVMHVYYIWAHLTLARYSTFIILLLLFLSLGAVRIVSHNVFLSFWCWNAHLSPAARSVIVSIDYVFRINIKCTWKKRHKTKNGFQH